MSLETVLKDIRERGKKEVAKLKKEAKEEAERILKDAKSKKSKIIDDALSEASKAAERLKGQEFSRVELENKRGRLMMEKQLLDKVIELAKEKISNLPSDKDRELMRKLITKHSSKGNVIFSSAKHETMVKAAASSLRYGGKIDCLGGIVVQSADGSVRYDFRYDTLLKAAADTSMKDVAQILFEG
jgi:V/A-type H+-transporting ATPase subunit E